MSSLRIRLKFFVFVVVAAAVLITVQIWKIQGPRKDMENVVSRTNHLKLNTLDTHSDMQDGLLKSTPALRKPRKFYVAFSYWEQLTMATNNLIALAALATVSGGQAVEPFVRDSNFRAKHPQLKLPTLASYFNFTLFNKKLLSHGYNTLATWKTFQDVCHDRLDLLMYLIYEPQATRLRQERNVSKPSVIPCAWSGRQHKQLFEGLRVATTICVDVGILKSIERFHDQVIKGRPCVGIKEWRGNGTKGRANFPLPSTIQFRLHALDVSFFNDKLLEIAHDFVSKKLGSNFISVHLRTEHILRHRGPISLVVKCITEMVARIQQERDRDPKNGNSTRKTFVAADFFQFGSHSGTVLLARKNSGLLMTVIEGLLENPTFFDPKAYHLVDSGSVAIVELYILASGSQMFSVGGGAFQSWPCR
ncbi:uncharacterized protein [Montipora capricornis]|uniref:uncharacterized protein isoform X3 n=1 Tax=Montipora foliosa TaxID=591990 RepID=UPI0035F20F17